MMISQTVWLNQLNQNPQVFRAATFLNGTFENLILECAFLSDVFWAHFILEALQTRGTRWDEKRGREESSSVHKARNFKVRILK